MEDSNREHHTLKDSLAVELTGKIMVAAIIVLFMVVVFVLLLHLYAKWFWWRVDESTNSPNQTRSRRRRRFVFVPGQDPAVARGQRRGLDPAILKSLPILAFHPEDFKDGLECAVCLSDLVQGEKARLLPKCNHGFHVDCIDMWFQSHSTCPLCRNPVASESSDSNASTITNGNIAENIQSPAENVAAGYTSESPNFPTNVLFWGNQTQVSSRAAVSEVEEQEGPSFEPPCPSSSSASSSPSTGGSSRPDGMLVIDIPSEINSSSLSPSASRFADEDLKSPMTTRLRSLKRLLSREKRSTACSPSSVDVEQVDRAQS
ncbi:RING-H2 finger protein-like protein [Quillaja saponaria]|uniref:RING-type E3 ubiquitin transferase n=1 Tax=Quillaja saponaria TaxID=32244 RepID=A0AAD7L4H5_QUISA|nr:RING-H2 finger protein-like protein [Quillaja saponaria]